MINKEHIDSLSGPLQDILQAELQAGNKIVETAKGGFTEESDEHIFIFLGKPFLTPVREDTDDIKYMEINDYHYWKAEYDDFKNNQTIACNFGRHDKE